MDDLARVRQLEQQLQEKQTQLEEFQAHLDSANAQLQQVLQDVQLYIQAVQHMHNELVPSRVAQISGFEFSYKFVPGQKGGDFFDVSKIRNSTKFAILLGACSRSAQSAALMMAVLQHPLSKGAGDLSPQAFAQQVIGAMAASSKEGLNLLCAVVDRRNFELSYWSQGHNLCFCVRKKDGAVEEIVGARSSVGTSDGVSDGVGARDGASAGDGDGDGDGVGASTSSSVSVGALASCQLEVRDKIVLCTVGVVEAQNSRGEAFGRAGLRRVLQSGGDKSAHDLRHEILFQLSQWQNEGTQGQNEGEQDQNEGAQAQGEQAQNEGAQGEAVQGQGEGQMVSQTPQPTRDQSVFVCEVQDKVVRLNVAH